jgi:formamidopyrimidine-DNA glycosylase
MPELPEVETTRRSLEPGLLGRRVTTVIVRDRRLRWPVPPEFEAGLTGATIANVGRRAKYLLLGTDRGTAMIHLGMSGSLMRVPADTPVAKHDHVDVALDDHGVLRFHDPRRFGSIHWIEGDPAAHPLLASLAPEPSDAAFDGAYLHRVTRGRAVAIKHILMNGQLVTGVGNIYASEALHRAGIHPKVPGRRISRERCERLVAAVKETLARAIAAGGSSLRDYVDGAGNPGHFQTESAVYGRGGAPCPRCGGTIRLVRQGQRSTFYCPGCQR